MKITDETKAMAQAIINYWDFTGKQEQSDWVTLEDEYEDVVNPEDFPDDFIVHKVVSSGQDVKICNSTMCAAGTAVFLNTKDDREFMKIVLDNQGRDDYYETRGAELLGLDPYEAARLFYSDNATARVLMQAIADGDANTFKNYEDYESV